MNCNDIATMLDDGDCAALDADGRRAVDLHLAACPDCRQAWSVHARLVGKFLPGLPPSLIQQCEAMLIAGAASSSRRRLGRRVALVIGVVALAAAAAIFALRPQSEADVAGTASVRPEQRAQPVTPRASQSGAALSPALREVSVGKPIHAPQDKPVSFLVEVSPVNSLDETDRAAFDAFHVAFVQALRRAPGIVLLVAGAAAEPPVVADYEVTLGATRRDGALLTRTDVGRADGIVLPLRAELGPDCGDCFEDAARLGENLVRTILRMMAPADASERASAALKLQDRRLTPSQRLDALRSLDTRRWTGNVQTALRRPDPTRAALRDPAVVRDAIDLAATATDPAHRAEVWRTMRGIGDPMLVDPLASAAQTDPAYLVRTEAVATLAADFAGVPRARAVLEVVARVDARSVVRALAQRGLSGDEGWRSHVARSLADTTLPDMERLDALLFEVRHASPNLPLLRTLLDDAGIRTLARILPGASRAGLAASDVQVVLQHLATSQSLDEPSVRAAFERIAASDPDAQSRTTAAQVLHGGQ